MDIAMEKALQHRLLPYLFCFQLLVVCRLRSALERLKGPSTLAVLGPPGPHSIEGTALGDLADLGIGAVQHLELGYQICFTLGFLG
jgi:hypothetical protein